MTENEWQTCTDPQPMLAHLLDSGRATDRKLRLFAVACCRRVSHLFDDVFDSEKAVTAAEQFADGRASQQRLELFRQALSRRHRGDIPRAVVLKEANEAANSTAEAVIAEVRMAALLDDKSIELEKVVVIARKAGNSERSGHASLLRDIFRNPFQFAPAFDESWRPPHAVGHATSMYKQRDFTQMAALGDALEAAGCKDADILGHCRSRSEHVRGCWVVDLVTGRE
jgi:hypothetical protein